MGPGIGLLLGNLSFVACLPQLTHCLGTGSCPNHIYIYICVHMYNTAHMHIHNVGPCLLWPPPPGTVKTVLAILNTDLAGGLGDLSIALVLPLLSLVLPALPLGLPLLGLVLPALPVGLPLLSIASTSFWAATTWFSIASTSFWVDTLRLDIKHGTQTMPLKEDRPPLWATPFAGLFGACFWMDLSK